MLKKIPFPERQIAYMAFVNREKDFRHTAYDEEMKQYELMKAGDMAAVEESVRMMERNRDTNLSVDPVQNNKYLFVACVTIATRFALEGGMDSETAYNSSDLYIRQLDKCDTVDEVMELHREMFTYFTKRMAQIERDTVLSKPVFRCMGYIEAHLHVPIRVDDLAGIVGLNPSYLSTLFKKETGVSISDYIMQKRIDTAKNMLRYSDYTSAEISEILSFSSQSHFIRSFKNCTGMTPGEYQKRHYRESIHVALDKG